MRAAVTIREERDPAFWQAIADHPKVRHIKGGQVVDMAAIVGMDKVIPLATDHGGQLFVQLDGPGRVYEMHTLFTPEGWGREAHAAWVQTHNHMFNEVGADLLVTYETDHPQSRAALSFGWRPLGELRDSPVGRVRTWFLTREGWEQSPAKRH